MLNRDSCFLLMVDIQGKLATTVEGHEAVIANSALMIQGAQILGIPIIVCEQKKLGATVAPLAGLLRGQVFFQKDTFSAWGEQEIQRAITALGGKKQAIIMGLETHICVYQTVRDLLQEGFATFVLADACASRKKENKNIALDILRQKGAQIISLEMALFELLVTAQNTLAKQVFAIVK